MDPDSLVQSKYRPFSNHPCCSNWNSKPKKRVWIVVFPAEVPSFVLTPPDAVKVAEGQTVALDCAASGIPSPTVSWKILTAPLEGTNGTTPVSTDVSSGLVLKVRTGTLSWSSVEGAYRDIVEVWYWRCVPGHCRGLVLKVRTGTLLWSGFEGAYRNIVVVWCWRCVPGHSSGLVLAVCAVLSSIVWSWRCVLENNSGLHGLDGAYCSDLVLKVRTGNIGAVLA